ncbi:MAG: hypothetical protein ABUK01_11685 [Leptospirales bacterium]
MNTTTMNNKKSWIDPMMLGILGCESMAIFGMLSPTMHGVAGFFDMSLMQGQTEFENLEFIHFVENSIGWMIEPLLFISILFTAIGFKTISKKYSQFSVKRVVWSLLFFAFTRLIMMVIHIVFASMFQEYSQTGNPASFLMMGPIKGIAALLAAIGGIISAYYMSRYFQFFEASDTSGPGKTGGTLIIGSVMIGVFVKTMSIYIWPFFLTNIFFLSMALKSIGISMIAMHMYKLGENHEIY